MKNFIKSLKNRTDKCAYCLKDLKEYGEKHANMMLPPSRGGRRKKSNVVIICLECVNKKSNMTLAEYNSRYGIRHKLLAWLRKLGDFNYHQINYSRLTLLKVRKLLPLSKRLKHINDLEI